MTQVCSSALLLAGLVALANGNAFLEAQTHVTKEQIEQALFSEFAGLADSAKLRSIEEELRPMYAALPKDEGGTLEHSTIRYALHRYFARRHGWYVQGLDPTLDVWNVTSPTSVMEALAPSYIFSLFSQRLHGQGMGLRDLAIFAATLLDLVHAESIGHLERIHSILQLHTGEPMSQADADNATQAWLMEYLLGINLDTNEYNKLEAEMMEIYPSWQDTNLWAQDIRGTRSFKLDSRRNPFSEQRPSFDDSAALVQELGHQLGFFQNMECRALKHRLEEMDIDGTGRVPLSRFYASADESWHFTESSDYLRNLGALDETDPRKPSVMIANYVNSQSNCMTPSSFYSVCCLDECEGLLGQLEHQIAAPSASPAVVGSKVANLQSDSVYAPRNLSVALLSRLDEIARLHDGTVPLHSRMFAQWMHHAFPRECSFPHIAGTMAPLTPFEWMSAKGVDSSDASDEEMQRHIQAVVELDAAEATPDVGDTALPWVSVEELIVGYKHTAHSRSTPATFTPQHALGYAALVAVVVSMVRGPGVAKAGPLEGKNDRYLV